jgi:anaerobic selenocysteine-containing dehydrogenase
LVSDTPQLLAERIAGGTPYPVNALFFFATNPLANHPAKEALASALKKVPFIVSFSPFLDESNALADLILPDQTYLERWQDDQVTHLAGFTCFSLARPAAAPLNQTTTRRTYCFSGPNARRAGGAELSWKNLKSCSSRSGGLIQIRPRICASAPPERSLRKVLSARILDS